MLQSFVTVDDDDCIAFLLLVPPNTPSIEIRPLFQNDVQSPAN